MRLRHVVVAGLMTVVAGAGPAAAGPPPSWSVTPAWTHDGYGPGNGGFNPAESRLVPSRVGELRQRWSIPATGTQVCARQAPPVSDGGAIFLPGRESVGAFDADTGEKIWTYPYADPMDTRTPLLAVSSGLLLVATSGCQSVSAPSGELLALDAATGALRWKAQTTVPETSLIVDGGVAVVAGGNAEWMATTAFSVATGRRLWERPLAMPAAGVSALGTALLTVRDTVFRPVGAVAVDIATGGVRWRTGSVWSVRAADDTGRFLLAGDPAGTLLKVDATSGTIAWARRGLGGPLAVDRDQIYVASGTDLVCVTAGSGREVWRQGGFASPGRPVVAGGVVYVVSPKDRLDTLDAANGHRLGFTATNKPVDHPVVDGGRLYLTDGDRLRVYTTGR
jgi:outer membrane protein assembly factor BamB